jgi:hypothetical protein
MVHPPLRLQVSDCNTFLIMCDDTSAVRGCIQKFPDLPLGARTANGTALCH